MSLDGLTCPECGSARLTVQQTVCGRETVVRRRRCPQGHCFTTEEAVCDSERYNEAVRERANAKPRRKKSCGYFDCSGCAACAKVSAGLVAVGESPEDSSGCLPAQQESSGTAARPATSGVGASVEVDRDTDGELLIDCAPGPGRMVMLSLRADGRLSYAFTWDGEKSHGTAQMPAGAKGRS